MEKPGVSIVIVNYNVRELLIKCISSVVKLTHDLPFEIIVIDNDSIDDSVSAVREKFPQVILISNKSNVGFPAANNQGLRIASGKYIFLLNPDTELTDNSVLKLQSYLEDFNEVDIVVPQLLNSDKTVQKSVFRFPKIRYIIVEMFYLERLFKSKYYGEKNLNESFPVESASGAALFFRKALIDKIGMLNEKLFWIEDVDFCYRTIKSGGKIVYYPDVKIIHHSGQSAKKNYNISISNQVVNKIKFYKVHGNIFQLIIVRLVSLINVLMRIIVFGLLSPVSKIYFLKMKAYVYTLPMIFTSTNGL